MSVAPVERQYAELVRRFPALTLPSDFLTLVPTWHQQQLAEVPDSLGCRVVPLDRPVKFDHDSTFPAAASKDSGAIAAPTAAAGSAGGAADPVGGRRWSARVLLVHGLDAITRDDILKSVHNGGQNLVNALRWVWIEKLH